MMRSLGLYSLGMLQITVPWTQDSRCPSELCKNPKETCTKLGLLTFLLRIFEQRAAAVEGLLPTSGVATLKFPVPLSVPTSPTLP